MSFSEPIATALVDIEPVVNQSAFTTAATQAADNFNRQLSSGFGRGSAGIQNVVKNLQAGFSTLGQVIAARLPAGVTQAANVISQKLGAAFGTARAAAQQLNSGASSVFSAISSGATGAAIAVGTLAIAAIKVTESFAKTADAFQNAEIGLNAVINANQTAGITTEALTGDLRALGAGLGVSSVGLSRAAQQLIAVGVSGSQTERILTAITKSGAAFGASQEAIGRALDGVTQIASKGTLQMEELRRQIAGNLPGAINTGRVFEILAKQMGVSVTEVQKLQKAGQITATQALPAITQALEEGTDGIDVFALRAQTLSGLLGILKENFNQIVGTSFKSFIDAVLPSFKGFIDSIKAGTGPFQNLSKDISQLGKIMGENLVKILNQVVPLLPQIFSLFVKLTGVIAPIIVEIVNMGATLSKILLPVLNVFASVLDVVFNKLGPLSSLLRIIAGGLIIGGVVKGFELFGRALGSVGGFLGRIATPLSKLLKFVGEFAPAVAKAATALGLFKGPIDAVAGALGGFIDKISDAIGWLGRLPGVSQFVGAVKAVGGAISDAFGSESQSNISDFSHALLGGIGQTLTATKGLSIGLSQINTALQDVIDNQEKLEKAQKTVTDAQDAYNQSVKKEKDARHDVVVAVQAEADAKEKLQGINDKLIQLEADRAKILSDTTADIREIAAAQRDLQSIGFKLLDIDNDRADTLKKIKELSTGPSADEIASADNKVARATIAVNQAKREEAALLDDLNKSQETSADLSGLTLDQLRTRLAGLRQQAAAQRAVKKTGKSEQEIQDDITIAHLNTVDAQIDLNSAIQDRADLDNVVINNQSAITGLTNHLKELENDKAAALADQVTAQTNLNTLLGGTTTQSEAVKKIDEDIKTLKGEQKTAVEAVQTATADISVKEGLIKDAVKDTRDRQREIVTAKADQKLINATLLGTENDINKALTDRIGLNTDLANQSSTLVSKALVGVFSTITDSAQASAISAIVGANFSIRGQVNPAFANNIADIVLNNPNKLRDLLRALGVSGFEEGGLVTHPTLSMMGERFKHEMVLPLTKPNRVWSLLAQNLPKYPGALRAAQNAISPASIPSLPKAVNLGSKRVVSRDDGPATYGQIKELIAVLREQRTEVHVEAPITVNDQTGIPEHLLRKLSRQVEKNVLDKISRR